MLGVAQPGGELNPDSALLGRLSLLEEPGQGTDVEV